MRLFNFLLKMHFFQDLSTYSLFYTLLKYIKIMRIGKPVKSGWHLATLECYLRLQGGMEIIVEIVNFFVGIITIQSEYLISTGRIHNTHFTSCTVNITVTFNLKFIKEDRALSGYRKGQKVTLTILFGPQNPLPFSGQSALLL